MIGYAQIYEKIKEKILAGTYDANHPIPSERALMAQFGVSRNAIRHAMDVLEKAKFIRRQHGRRSVVVYGGRGHRIGLIPCVAESDFFQPLALKVSELCLDGGYSLILSAMGFRVGSVFDADEITRKIMSSVRNMVDQHVSGVLFQPVSFLPNAEEVNEKVLSYLTASGVPVVLIDYDAVLPPKRSAYDVVGIDNVAASLRLCEHLVANGARRIHFFRRPNCSNVVTSRLRGVALGSVMAGLPWSDDSVLTCEVDDKEAIRHHLKRKPAPDAIVCGFDAMAVKVLDAASSLGLSVPRQLKVAGFDDSISSRLSTPALTTICQPLESIAEAAFRRLQARIIDPSLQPVDILLPAPLVVRGSTQL